MKTLKKIIGLTMILPFIGLGAWSLIGFICNPDWFAIFAFFAFITVVLLFLFGLKLLADNE
jgi:hypothetical protein